MSQVDQALTAIQNTDDPAEFLKLLEPLSPTELHDNSSTIAEAIAYKLRNNKAVHVIPALAKRGFNAGVLFRVSPNDSAETTLLHIAAECAHDEMIYSLLLSGVDINCTDSTQKTPLHVLAHEIRKWDTDELGYQEEALNILLAARARLDVKDSEGKTPNDYAGMDLTNFSHALEVYCTSAGMKAHDRPPTSAEASLSPDQQKRWAATREIRAIATDLKKKGGWDLQ